MRVRISSSRACAVAIKTRGVSKARACWTAALLLPERAPPPMKRSSGRTGWGVEVGCVVLTAPPFLQNLQDHAKLRLRKTRDLAAESRDSPQWREAHVLFCHHCVSRYSERVRW